jgi:two-component system CheB/CheR fusion protein
VVVVGIGASAGALGALREFFAQVADDSGLAYVVVVHLSPEHESHLPDLLQPHSAMPVIQVSGSSKLNPNCVYVIPPNANLTAIDTHVRLSPLEEKRLERAPIDHFFRTLAEQHGSHAIGVVLTGTGSDGTLGIKEIKLHGGLTVVQDPNEAEYDGMPQSAIATGFVDLVLPVSAIPQAVLRFARTEPNLPLAVDGDLLRPDHRVLLQKVLAQVRARTGRDFARYKRSTIMRRMQRRMQLRHIEEPQAYLDLLRQNGDEVRELADDLLITVTSFFRDPLVFKHIEEKVVPALFKGRGAREEVRVWCVGCATGEEVYSIAMLFLEEAGRRQAEAPRLHLFATDLHPRSLEIAREGFYAGDITSELSRERLQRFFVEETGGYRIRKDVREMVVFAPHNLLSDPPFSRLDLVVCRNLLIYLQRDVQHDVLRVFHYALRAGGFLVLGTSESTDDAELFRTVDKKLSIHQRGQAENPEPRLPVFPIVHRGDAEFDVRNASMEPRQYMAMHAALVKHFALPSALVGPDGQLVHLSSDAGRYLEHPGGRMTANALKLVRKELSTDLITALHTIRKERRPIHSPPIPVQFNGGSRPVVLHVHPSTNPDTEGYCLVIFEEVGPGSALSRTSQGDGADARYADLASELDLTRQRLQGLIEEFETSQEEMKASNEELQSSNEELRSTMEELETSKEELQSMNEELQTVNQENRHKVAELALLSGDLQNLLTATDIATLFLDRELRILRFTPKVGEIFNMRMTDRGRPVTDLTHRLGYPELNADAEAVLRNLQPSEREVQDEDGRWYLTRLLPYRSVEDRIAGVVITFVDITRRKRSEEELQQLSRNLEGLVGERTRQVRDLTSSLVRAEQRERRRLSETLHDELQQVLYGVQLQIKMARDAGDAGGAGRADEAAEHLQHAQELLGRGMQVTRQLSVDLNPPILRNEGLGAILEWLQSQMKELHGLDVRVKSDGDFEIDDRDARVLLFQVFRELLFNVAKHSGTRSATVSLGHSNGQLQLEVADKGGGFDAVAVDAANRDKPSLGLTSVRERVGLLGGTMTIESAAGSGTVVTLRIPKSARIGALAIS